MRTLEGPIEKVVVYREAAVVTRVATVQVGPGDHDLELVGLPVSLVDASVRVQATAEGRTAHVAQVRVGLYVAPRENLPEPPDEVELRRVRRRIASLRRRRDLAVGEQQSLRELVAPDRPAPPPGQPPGPSPLAARLALDVFITEGVDTRADEIRKLDAELEDLLRQKADLEQRLRLATQAQRVDAQEVTKSAQFRLRVGGASAAATVRVVVRYQVRGTVWRPAYQVRVTDDEATITLRALVAQHSGEDWRGVKLEVSTANPASWTELPKMTALRVSRKQTFEAIEEPPRPAPAGADGLFADFDAQRQRLQAPRARKEERTAPALTPLLDERLDAPAFGAPIFTLEERERGATDEDDEMAFGAAVPAPRSRGGGGEVRMAAAYVEDAFAEIEAPAAMEPTAASPKRRMRRRKESVDGGAKLMKSAAPPPPPALPQTALQAFEAQLYDELELGGLGSDRRGQLVRVERMTTYARSIARFGMKLDVDLQQHVLLEQRRVAASPQDGRPPKNAAGAFDYTYPADLPVDVPSDGAVHSVPLSLRSCPCALTYVTVPRIDPSVYRQARLENPEPSPLLAGPAEIYVDGEYVLTAELPTVAGQGRFELGLGVEQSVRCARNVRFREDRSSDTVVATNDLHHDLRYTLANDLDRDVECEVRERVPIPDEDAEVVIEERDVSPPWSPYDQKERQHRIKGGRRWQVTVPARGKTELSATYVVRIYANHQVVGGNRRER